MKLLCFYVAQICQIKFIGHSIHSEVKDPFEVLLSITTKYLFYCLVKTRDFFFCYIHHHREILKSFSCPRVTLRPCGGQEFHVLTEDLFA